jgi:hypothetical protein
VAVIKSSTSGWPPSPQFWVEEFPRRTAGATEPALFKGLLPDTEGATQAVGDAFSHIQRHPSGPWRLRLYLGEDRRDDLLERLRDEPFERAKDFDAFVRRAVGAERYCIVVNNLEVASPQLAWSLGELLDSMHKHRGAPLGGSEQVAFIGNYSGTPFGVHEGFEDAFLVHLGPGVKRFYCWSNEQYSLLTGGRAPTFGDYSWLLDSATEFILEPGDVFFLPAEVYHVGVQSELSVSVAIPLYTFPLERFFLRAVLPSLAEELLAEVDGNPSDLLPFDPHSSLLDERMQGVGILLLEQLAQRLSARLPPLLHDHWLRVYSNGGWEPVAANEDVGLAESTARDDVLALQAPSRLVWEHAADDDRNLHIYARGRRVIATSTPALLEQLEVLHDGGGVRLALADPDTVQVLAELSHTGALVSRPDRAQETSR